MPIGPTEQELSSPYMPSSDTLVPGGKWKTLPISKTYHIGEVSRYPAILLTLGIGFLNWDVSFCTLHGPLQRRRHDILQASLDLGAEDTTYGNASPRKTTKTFQQVYAANAYDLLDPMVLHICFRQRWCRTSGNLTEQTFRCLENLASPNSYSPLEKYLLACYWALQRLNTRPWNVSE